MGDLPRHLRRCSLCVRASARPRATLVVQRAEPPTYQRPALCLVPSRSQLGANRGPGPHEAIFEYAANCSWRGLAFEPVAATFDLLCRNYEPWRPHVRPVQAAVSNFNGPAQMALINSYCPRGECNRLTQRNTTRTGKLMPTEQVEVVTLARVWEELRRVKFLGGCKRCAQRVDVLVVDVEGQEEQVLYHGAPFPHPPPRLVLYEDKHLKASQKERIAGRLHSQGYTLIRQVLHPARNGAMHNGDVLYGLNGSWAVRNSPSPSARRGEARA